MQKRLLGSLSALALLVAAPRAGQAQLRPLRGPVNVAAPAAALRPAGNTNFRLLTSVKQQFRPNGGAPAAWLDTLRFTYSRFTAFDKPLREQRDNARTRGAALTPLRQEWYRYNAAGQVISDTTYTYTNGVLNTVGTLANLSSYDAQGRLQQEMLSIRISGNWRPYTRTTYFYNAQGQNTRIAEELYVVSSYGPSSQELFTYNAQGQLVVDEFQAANLAGTAYDPIVQELHTYNAAGQRATTRQQNYTNNAYQDAYRVTFTYGTTATGVPASNQLAGYLVERAATAPGTWAPFGRGTQSYDADGNLTTDLYEFAGPNGGGYVPDYRYNYTYQRTLATAGAQRLAADLSLAPNPAAAGSALILRYRLPAAAPVSVQVLDGLGREVLRRPAEAQAAGPHTLTLPALPTAPGLYALRLSAGPQSQTLKLLVE